MFGHREAGRACRAFIGTLGDFVELRRAFSVRGDGARPSAAYCLYLLGSISHSVDQLGFSLQALQGTFLWVEWKPSR